MPCDRELARMLAEHCTVRTDRHIQTRIAVVCTTYCNRRCLGHRTAEPSLVRARRTVRNLEGHTHVCPGSVENVRGSLHPAVITVRPERLGAQNCSHTPSRCAGRTRLAVSAGNGCSCANVRCQGCAVECAGTLANCVALRNLVRRNRVCAWSIGGVGDLEDFPAYTSIGVGVSDGLRLEHSCLKAKSCETGAMERT